MGEFSIERGVPLEGVTIIRPKDAPAPAPIVPGEPAVIIKGDKKYVRCTCAWCPSKAEFDYTDVLGTSPMDVFIDHDWGATSQGRLICPSCEKRHKEERMRELRRDQERRDRIAERQMTDPEALVREATVAEIARITRFIEEHFGDGRYDEGWSDKRIGELLELPVAMVAKVRTEAYGELRDTALEDLRAEFNELRESIHRFAKKLTDYERAH
ncbi:MAG: hypothetical protein KGL39_03785 [Patescibacteria group bacterium]|nr:hypothetical protein [Patescibacteria group bacterium]